MTANNNKMKEAESDRLIEALKLALDEIHKIEALKLSSPQLIAIEELN